MHFCFNFIAENWRWWLFLRMKRWLRRRTANKCNSAPHINSLFFPSILSTFLFLLLLLILLLLLCNSCFFSLPIIIHGHFDGNLSTTVQNSFEIKWKVLSSSPSTHSMIVMHNTLQRCSFGSVACGRSFWSAGPPRELSSSSNRPSTPVRRVQLKQSSMNCRRRRKSCFLQSLLLQYDGYGRTTDSDAAG